jgi:putative peptidoglycan lipid II flippase
MNNSGVRMLDDDTYYPDLTMDMGSSLGYGQSIQHHAISMPQPTQSMPRLPQSRLQQLREERMRRQLRRMNPDGTMLGRRKGQPGSPQDKLVLPPGTKSGPLIRRENTARPFPPAPPGSPLPGAPGQPGAVPQTPDGRVNSPALVAADLQPAAEAAQDTGMIQRVKVARAGSLISGALMLSSVLGLVQTFLFTYVFGRSTDGDAYLQAYIIPNLIYTVVAGGALSSAFIPVFSMYSVGRKDEKTAWHIASSALNLSVLVMILFSIVGFFLAPVAVPLYTPDAKPAELALIVTLTRIMLIQAIVLGSGVIVGAILNTKQDFTRTALGAVLYNIGLDLGLIPGFLLTFHARTSSPADAAVYAATWGVVLGAILQLAVQIPGLAKVKMRYTFVFDWKHPGVRQIAVQMVPRIINAMMLSFSTAVDRALLSLLTVAAISGLINEYFQAFSILLLPVSIFGSAVSTAAFPTLAGYVARGRLDRVRSIIMETLRGILFLTIPSAVGLMVLSFPIVQGLLEHGNFDLRAAQYTSVVLLFFAIGLPALAAVEILTRSFYALQDTKTPVSISVAQFILKIALSIVLINMAVFGVQWGMGALALSTSIASILEAVVLFILLSQRIEGFDLRALMGFFGRVFVAGAAMAFVLFVLRLGLDHMIDTTSMQKLFIPGIAMALVKLFIELGCGALVFLVVARLFHMEEMNSGLVRRVLNLLRIPWL